MDYRALLTIILLTISHCVLAQNVTVPLPPLPIVASDFEHSAGLHSGFDLYWTIVENIILIGVSCEGEGWCAFGPSPRGMLDSDPFFGWIGDDGTPYVLDLKPTKYSLGCPGVCNDTQIGGVYNVLNYTGVIHDGKTQLIWARYLDTNDSVGDIVIDPNSKQTVVYAYNRHAKGPVQKHEYAEPLQLEWSTGSVSKGVDLKLIHGIFMFVGWVFIVPIAITVARYLKVYTWWFPVHWGSLTFAVILIIIAFGLAIDFTPQHFNNKHTIIGLVLFIEAILQVILGIIADRMYNPERESVPIFPDRVHQANGILTFLLATINVYFGIELYNQKPILLDLYYGYWGLVLGTLLLLYLGMFIYSLLKKDSDNPTDYESQKLLDSE